MTYLVPDQHGRSVIDLPRFAADLAKQLDGTLLPKDDYPNERQQIQVGADVVELHAKNHERPPKIVATISAPEVKWGDRNTYDAKHRTERASVNPERKLSVIAADIKRRVIEPSQEPLRLQREYASQQAANRRSIVDRAAVLKARMPMLSVRVNEENQNATLYGSGDQYVHATLGADGQVRIERIGSVSSEQFEQIMTVLGMPKGGDR